MNKEAKRAVAPMGHDSHMGAVRAVYTIKDAILLIHGGAGCATYPVLIYTLHDNYPLRILSSVIEGKNVIFGGEELLQASLEKTIEITRPNLVVVQNTCIPALTGDDSEGIARIVSKKTGVKIISTTNPNYKGNQLDGFNNVIKAYITELMKKPEKIMGKTVNLIGLMPGEFNWRSDLKEITRILNSIGLSINCTLLGDGTTVNDIINAPRAEANVLFYPEIGISAAKLMEEKFGTPLIETDFPPIGVEATHQWILKIAEFFGLKKEAEVFLEKEMEAMGKALSQLEIGQMVNLHFLFGKTYAIQAASFLIPAMVKFLYEDLSMIPTTIAFQEYDDLSFSKLEKVLKGYDLSPEILINGDRREYLEAIIRNHRFPGGDPWITFGSTLDALELAWRGERLPVIRFSYPVVDETIIYHRPFVGIRGVIVLTERIHNEINRKICYTTNAMGHIPDPFVEVEYYTRPFMV